MTPAKINKSSSKPTCDSLAPLYASSLPPIKSVILILILGLLALKGLMPVHNATYVPGAGFSGFWYSFGRISNLPNNLDRDYLCFSAGCLVVSSVFLGKDYTAVAQSAVDIQRRWKDGKISQYDVASIFVDDLLDLTGKPGNRLLQDEWLKQVYVLTSSWYTGANMKVAKNRGELRELLVQTSFIPFATGFGFNHEGSNDGGFSLLFHPRCEDNVMLPLTFQMFANILNVNMSMETVSELYDVGFQEEEAKRAPRAVLI